MYECKIAERLVELRNSRGLTQSEVAGKLSVSNKTVSKWENGMSTPDLSMLIELSRYYGVTTDALLGLEDIKKENTDELINGIFDGSDRKDAELQLFELVRAAIPKLFEYFSKGSDELYLNEKVLPIFARLSTPPASFSFLPVLPS